MDKYYSRIELLSLVKTYNKDNNDKIQNSDKMKKADLLNICKSLSLIKKDTASHYIKEIDLRNLSKKSIMEDISLHFIKQAKTVPSDVIAMKKNQLIDYMEIHNITHYTHELLEKEIKIHMEQDNAKKIIYYNIIRYDNVNVNDIDNDRLVEYIQANDLDRDMSHFNQYAKLLSTIYKAYDEFCNTTNYQHNNDKIKSFPKIIQNLNKIIEK